MAYNITKNYKQVIYSGGSRHKIKILFNNVELQEADRYCKRATIKSRIIPNGAKRFSLNNFISKEVEIILHDIDTSIIQDKVSISIGTLVGNSYEYVPIGIFNIQGTPTTDKNKITIKLRDNSVKFDFNYNAKPLIDEKGGSATKLQILQDICSKANVTCNITSFLGSTDSIGIYDNTITARQYIADIAEQAGKIATINRNGELIFVNLNSLTTWNIPLSIVEKYEIGKAYRIGKVVYEDAIRKYETASTNYDTLYLDASNPYISSQEQVNSILQQVNNFAIDSVKTGKILGNPAIDSYDLINIYNDKVEGNPSVFKTLATNELVYTGVLINTFNTQIGEEERKENVTVTGEATFKKWATTNINNINGEIDIQAGKIDNVEKEINPTQDATGTSFYLEDSTNAELVNFEMEGKTTQETSTQSANLFDESYYNDDSIYTQATYKYVKARILGNRTLYFKASLKEGKTIQTEAYICISESAGLPYVSDTKSAYAIRSGSITNNSADFTGVNELYINVYPNNLNVATIFDNYNLWVSIDNINYEPFVPDMPSPNYSSELVSVGYENLINKEQIILGYFRISDGTYLASTSTTYKSTELIPVSPNTKYYSNVIVFSSSAVGVTYWNDSGTFISGSALSSSHIYTTPSNAKYMRLSFKYADSDITDVDTLYLIKGTQSHSYIPYGKYGIEVKTQGKNLLLNTIKNATTYYGITFTPNYNSNGLLEYINVNGTATGNTSLGVNSKLYINKNTSYTLSGCPSGGTVSTYRFVCYLYDKDNKYLSGVSDLGNGATISNANVEYANILIYIASGTTCNNLKFYPMLEQGTQATEYEPYKENTQLYQLDNPLRSIGDTKDLLYIKNGMLYVERKIGSKILDGSENWTGYTTLDNDDTIWLQLLSKLNNALTINALNNTKLMSNYFSTYNVYSNTNTKPGICYHTDKKIQIRFPRDLLTGDTSSLANRIVSFKTWLSTHNTEVQYILASSNTEGVGKIEVPSTYKTITHIDTTDELEPNMNITYVMNTQITNYVQNQVNQIKITEDGILAEVNRKVDNEEIIAKLNLAIEDEQGIIEITGNQVTIDSDYFKLNADGTIKSTGGTIGGYKITDNMLYAETFAKYNYTENDLDKIRNYLMGTGTLTPEEFIKYDVNESGTVTSLDYVIIKFFIEYNVTPTSSAKIIMKTGNSISDNAYILQDGAGNKILNIGFNGIYYKDINLANTTTYSENELVVGKWIDNKPIYRKVIDIGNLPDASQTIVSHNISNIERIVKLYGSATRDSDKDTLPIPYVTFNANNSGGVTIYVNDTNVLISTSSDRTSYYAYVVLEYTKTSD